MMGMYIMGKEPDRCGVCPCFHAENPMYCQAVKAAVQKPRIVRPYANGRPDWCPLIEVPEPHGRLIDAEQLKETLDYYIREAGWGDEINKALTWVKDEFINSEPTIIPASEEDD